MIKRNITSSIFGRLFLFTALFFSGCSKDENTAKRSNTVFVSILPQKYIVDQISSGKVRVFALIKPGQNPANFEPAPGQMTALSETDLFLNIGVPSETAFLPKIKKALPALPVVHMGEGIPLRKMEASGHHDHEENCSHADKDPHIWLSPLLVKVLATNTYKALRKLYPEHDTLFQANLEIFLGRLDTLHAWLQNIFDPFTGSELFVFHPAFGYFADTYGLKQKAVETGGKEPGARALSRLIDEVKKHRPKAIFVQPQFSAKSAEAIAQHIGCAVIPINPLPADYITEMRHMGETILKGLNP